MRRLIGLLVVILAVGLMVCVKPAIGQESAKTDESRKAGDRLVKTVDGIEYAFRWCPPGKFLMGSPEEEEGRFGWEGPQHEVTLTKGFWMLETEVTQAMWQSVIGLNIRQQAGLGSWSKYPHGEGPNYPVYYLSWNDCQVFCRKLSEKIGLKLTLPTEAQWEYACRAGTTGPFAGDLDAMAWYGENGDTGSTHPVAQKQPNAWGLYDMHGNVWEWCQDRYAVYARDAETDPTGPDGGVYQVDLGDWTKEMVRAHGPNQAVYCIDRGGSWCYGSRYCRSAIRDWNQASYRYCLIGFRPVALEE